MDAIKLERVIDCRDGVPLATEEFDAALKITRTRSVDASVFAIGRPVTLLADVVMSEFFTLYPYGY
jgi:hypothetical protein